MQENVRRNAPCPCGSGRKYKHCCHPNARPQGLMDNPDSQGMTRDQFAGHLIAAIRKAGNAGSIDYDPHSFRLSEDGLPRLNLANAYSEYCLEPESRREALVKRWANTWFLSRLPLPDTYVKAAHALLPVVRERHYLNTSPHDILPNRLLSEHHVALLAFDQPETISTIPQEYLDKWGVDFDQAYQKCLENLGPISPLLGFTRQCPGFYASNYDDNYDTSRIVLPELFSGLDLRGDPVVMALNRSTLLVTGADDQDGLSAMAQFATHIVDHPRFRSGIPLRLVDSHWETYRPANDHPSIRLFKTLWFRTMSLACLRQRDALKERCQKEGIDVFVANYLEAPREPASEYGSCCVWSEGVPSLLPRTDFVCLLSSEFRLRVSETTYVADADQPVTVTWEILQKTVGDLMEPLDVYPARYHVPNFPSKEQIQTLRASPLTFGR